MHQSSGPAGSGSFGTRGEPGPRQLPGIEGFYLLTPDGKLGRYQADGSFSAEPALGSSLADKIDALIRQYRSGEVGELAIGLVTPSAPVHEWQTASLVLSENALHEFYRTGNEPEAPLTAFQRRNKTKSIFQGMEVILDARLLSQPAYPRCCPVLFVPEVGADELRRRYGVESVDPDRVLEVLDLMSPLSPEEKRHPYFSKMVMDMLATRIAPEMRSEPGLVLAASADDTGAAKSRLRVDPWPDEPETRDVSFHDGDPVTYWMLSWFAPFSQLNDLQRQFIARGLYLSKVRAGTTLIERGSLDDLTVYLLEGTIALEAFDGKKMEIVGGTKQAHLPISQLRPHAYTVKAGTDAAVILMSQKMVRDVTRITTTYKNRPAIDVQELTSLPDDIPGR